MGQDHNAWHAAKDLTFEGVHFSFRVLLRRKWGLLTTPNCYFGPVHDDDDDGDDDGGGGGGG